MADLSDIAKFVAADFRFFQTLVCGFFVGLLLLFIQDVPLYMKDVVLPGLVIYAIGTALIAYVQVLLTASANTKAKAEGGEPSGIKQSHLRIIIGSQIAWFVLLLVFLIW